MITFLKYKLLKGGTTLIAQLSWVIYLTLLLTRDRPVTGPQVFFLFILHTSHAAYKAMAVNTRNST